MTSYLETPARQLGFSHIPQLEPWKGNSEANKQQRFPSCRGRFYPRAAKRGWQLYRVAEAAQSTQLR